jgi:hypothetical protein
MRGGARADSAAVLDCGSSICVWLGAQLPEKPPGEEKQGEKEPRDREGGEESDGDDVWNRATVRAACMELVGRLSAGRFPVPEFRSVTEVRSPS